MDNLISKYFTCAALLGFLMIVDCAIAEPLSYSYLGAQYNIDSTVETEGGAFDSDDGWGIEGSYELPYRLYVWSRYGQGGWDLNEGADYSLQSLSTGLGGYAPLIDKEDYRVDFYVALSWEYMRTTVQPAFEESYEMTRNGAGFKAGIRAQVTKYFELSAGVYELSYGKRFIERKGGLDGLHFELGAALKIWEDLDLTLSYLTGELDYEHIRGIGEGCKIEVDREEMRLGLRYNF